MQYSFIDILFGIISNQFFLQLVVAQLMFSTSLHKRKGQSIKAFWFRAVTLVLVMQVVASLIFMTCYLSDIWIIQNTLCYAIIFIWSIVYLHLLYDESLQTLLWIASLGYMLQHISSQVCEIVLYPLKPEDWTILNPVEILLKQVIQWPIFILIYFLLYYIFEKESSIIAPQNPMYKNMTKLSITTLVVVLFLSSIRDAFSKESLVLSIISRIFSLFCCFLILYLRTYIIQFADVESEREFMEQMYQQRMKQFNESKENIELINHKCHDLRHQIEVWEHSSHRPDAAELAEIKSAIDIYDSKVSTGNETLDVLFTEKSIYCDNYGIRLSCIIDGKKIGFMSVGDICSLFGNALENAIEAVMKLDNPEDRIISFQVKERNGMLIVTVDNYYNGNIMISDGLPISEKGDERYHGFGTKSIKRVAEKYGGTASIVLDEMFHLTILLPIPKG